MSCVICDYEYNDHVEDRKCYNICANGHTICKECLDKLLVITIISRPTCPTCRLPIRGDPIFTRINNSEDAVAHAPAAVVPVSAAPAPAILMSPAHTVSPVVILIDISGSMQRASGDQSGAPTRLELAVHMVKITLAFCRKLDIRCVIYTFSESLDQIPIDITTNIDRVNATLEDISIDRMTHTGWALKKAFEFNGPAAKYFMFTDGEPTDSPYASISLYENTQLHLLAFSDSVDIDMLRAIGNNPQHTISYVQDVRSLPGYMVPIFIWAATDMKKVTLSAQDEQLRVKYIERLAPQVRGDLTRYKLVDLVQLLNSVVATSYSRDLLIDTAGTPAHSRIEFSFQPENWKSFGRFYLVCALTWHTYLIPSNGFDPSLRHYRTPEYHRCFEQIADIPAGIPFVAFMSPVAERAAASAAAVRAVSTAMACVDSYSSSSYDAGCIGGEALVRIYHNGKFTVMPMKNVQPGYNVAYLTNGTLNCPGPAIKWIIRICNLNGGESIPLYNGLTASHPVWAPGCRWAKAKDYPKATLTYTTDIVYDVVLEELSIPVMTVNDTLAAVAGYPIPSMVHPYWGSQKVIEEMKSVCPGGGFVDVDAKNFQYADGLVCRMF